MSAIERCRTAALGGHVAKARLYRTQISFDAAVERITASAVRSVTQEWRAHRVPGFYRDRANRHGFDHALAQQAHRLLVIPRSQDRTLPPATPSMIC
jgi:hypothetical protein